MSVGSDCLNLTRPIRSATERVLCVSLHKIQIDANHYWFGDINRLGSLEIVNLVKMMSSM